MRATREASKSIKFADVLKERGLCRFHDEEAWRIIVKIYGPLNIMQTRGREH